MEINKKSETELIALFEKAVSDSSLELEFLLQYDSNIIDEKTFERIIKELRKYSNLHMKRTETLDVSCKGFRFTINGNESIRKYCRTDRITPDMEKDIVIQKKTKK